LYKFKKREIKRLTNKLDSIYDKSDSLAQEQNRLRSEYNAAEENLNKLYLLTGKEIDKKLADIEISAKKKNLKYIEEKEQKEAEKYQKIYIIFAIDNNEVTIRKTSNLLIDKLQNFVKELQENLDTSKFKVIPRFYIYQTFNKKYIQYISKHLRTYPNDIVLFFSFTHGLRTPEDKNPYPRIILGKFGTDITKSGDTLKYSMQLAQIASNLKKLTAKLTITIGEACNSANDIFNIISSSDINIKLKDTIPLDINALQVLWEEQKGNLLCSSSSPGEIALAFPNSAGGIFDLLFFNAYKYECSSNRETTEPNWRNIFDNTQKRTIETTEKDEKMKMTPQWTGKIGYDRKITIEGKHLRTFGIKLNKHKYLIKKTYYKN